jgi:formimidoylglutamate deiminase
MYDHANTLDLGGLEDIALLTYIECLEGGYTSVGEFHYLHRDLDGSAYSDPVATARAHIRAANKAGIRIALAWCVYHRAHFDAPLTAAQRRFRVDSVRETFESIDRLGDLRTPTCRVDLALHSVRAVPRDWMGPLASEARARGLKMHVHVSEQRSEVRDCRAHTGLTPIGLLAAEGVLGPDVLLVHATWLDEADIDLIARSGATVVLCPTTEGDLGDGIPPIAALCARGVPMALGSDSHAVIDPFAELRHAEYLARVTSERRVVFADPAGEASPALLALGASAGQRALGFDPGDRVVLDASNRVFERAEDPLATALLGGHRGLVREVEVAGATVVEGFRWCG